MNNGTRLSERIAGYYGRGKAGYALQVFFLLLLWLFAASLSVYGREVTDMSGRKVTLPDVIHKVVGISPPATYLLYALDPTLIGGLNFPPRESEKKYMAPGYTKLPVIGGLFGQGRTINQEALLRIKPDFVLYWQWKDAAIEQKLRATMAQLGLPLVAVRLDSIEDYPAALLFLGDVLNRKERAHKLYRYAMDTVQEAKAIKSRLKNTRKVRVYYAEGLDGLSTEPEGSIHAELIPLAGGENVHKGEQFSHYGMEKISMEQVLLYNPEVILVKERAFYNRIFTDPRWQNIRAVRDRRVYLIPYVPFNWFDRPPSFMRLLGIKWLLNILHPEHYSINMVAETRAFYKLFLRVDISEKEAREILNQ
ncbi:MAG: ABC transporter substrate-binding protein [Deltaproteobacteria bacterium]